VYYNILPIYNYASYIKGEHVSAWDKTRLVDILSKIYPDVTIDNLDEKIQNGEFSVIDSIIPFYENALLEFKELKTPKQIRDKAIFETLYGTGVKVSELIDMNIDDVDLDLDYICCESGKSSRIIPISQITKKYIVKYIDKSRPEFVKDNYKEKALFVNSNGERFSRQGLWKLIKKYANIANIDKNINPTMLRHSFAIHLLNEGANIVVVSKILGNSNLSSLQSYLDYVNKNIRQELREKHPRK
jgi:integrase/recombinase XerD